MSPEVVPAGDVRRTLKDCLAGSRAAEVYTRCKHRIYGLNMNLDALFRAAWSQLGSFSSCGAGVLEAPVW